jgi:hypothetical protein
MRTDYVHLGNEVFSKELLLISLENLYHLQRQSILLGTTPSELINKLITQAAKDGDDE